MHTDRLLHGTFLKAAVAAGAAAVVGSADTAGTIQGEVPRAPRKADAPEPI
jgi:hypothetical protein